MLCCGRKRKPKNSEVARKANTSADRPKSHDGMNLSCFVIDRVIRSWGLTQFSTPHRSAPVVSMNFCDCFFRS